MCRKLIYLISFVLLLGLINNASAELVAHWRLDEGSGTTVVDATGNVPDGTFEGDPQWVAGKFGAALEFDGDDWVNLGNPPALVITEAITITCWINPAELGGERGFAGLDAGYAFKAHDNGVRFTTPGILDHGSTNITLQVGTWQHVAASFQPGQSEGLLFYYNGVETERITSSAMNAGTGPFRIGNNQWGETYTGIIDDVRVYNHILTEPEILAAMEGTKGYPYAFGPTPADDAFHADTWVNLSWRAGDFSVSHNVYLGDNFDDVNSGAESTFQGNQASTFLVAGFPGFAYPDGLVPGTTYYWR
ncbi:MAG: LamG domain-containing protein, partial [Sedimentisphaerales bacterium]